MPNIILQNLMDGYHVIRGTYMVTVCLRTLPSHISRAASRVSQANSVCRAAWRKIEEIVEDTLPIPQS